MEKIELRRTAIGRTFQVYLCMAIRASYMKAFAILVLNVNTAMFCFGLKQSRSQSPCYPCPAAERTTSILRKSGESLYPRGPCWQLHRWTRVTRTLGTRLGLKMISSPYCACSGFVFIFVLKLLIRYTSVLAYMKFLSPPLRVVTFRNAR